MVEPVLTAGLAVVAALAFTRLLPPGQLTTRVVVAAVTSTVVALACRRLAPGRTGISLGASVVAYVVAAGILVYARDTLAGLPTPSSVHAVLDGLVNGSARILTSAVPTPPVASAVLIPVTVAWVVAWAGAELAGRTRTPLLPALPAVLGFGFGLAFGGPGQLVGLTAALVAITAALGVWRALPEGASRGTRLRRLITLGVPLVAVLTLATLVVSVGLGPSADQFDLHHRHPATARPSRRPSPRSARSRASC